MPKPIMQPSTYKRSYDWAVNPLKLKEAIDDLEAMKRMDSSLVITEDVIKDRYILRKGEVRKRSVPKGAIPVRGSSHPKPMDDDDEGEDVALDTSKATTIEE